MTNFLQRPKKHLSFIPRIQILFPLRTSQYSFKLQKYVIHSNYGIASSWCFHCSSLNCCFLKAKWPKSMRKQTTKPLVMHREHCKTRNMYSTCCTKYKLRQMKLKIRLWKSHSTLSCISSSLSPTAAKRLFSSSIQSMSSPWVETKEQTTVS